MSVSLEVQRVMEGEGISLDELQAMVERSAITSVRGFNRRFNDWIFVVKNGVVCRMQPIDMIEVGQGRDIMYEPHTACLGRGCKECGWSGEIIRKI